MFVSVNSVSARIYFFCRACSWAWFFSMSLLFGWWTDKYVYEHAHNTANVRDNWLLILSNRSVEAKFSVVCMQNATNRRWRVSRSLFVVLQLVSWSLLSTIAPLMLSARRLCDWLNAERCRIRCEIWRTSHTWMLRAAGRCVLGVRCAHLTGSIDEYTFLPVHDFYDCSDPNFSEKIARTIPALPLYFFNTFHF